MAHWARGLSQARTPPSSSYTSRCPLPSHPFTGPQLVSSCPTSVSAHQSYPKLVVIKPTIHHTIHCLYPEKINCVYFTVFAMHTALYEDVCKTSFGIISPVLIHIVTERTLCQPLGHTSRYYQSRLSVYVNIIATAEQCVLQSAAAPMRN